MPFHRSTDGPPSSGAEASRAVPRSGSVKSLIRVTCDAGANPTEQLLAFLTSYASVRYPAHLAQRVSVAAYELIENGLSYGSVANEVVFEMLQDDAMIELAVTNHAVPARISRLREQVARLKVDAATAYAEEMKRSLQGGIQRSMLGLARVVHEARMELSVEESAQGRVVVSARCKR
jgi:hypothetical protein